MRLSLSAAALGIFFAPLAQAALGGVFICQGANATGHCEYGVYELEVCHDLPPELRNNAATFAPDGEAFYCYPKVTTCDEVCRSPQGCTLGAVTFDYEHKYDLSVFNWDKYIASFWCYENRTATE